MNFLDFEKPVEELFLELDRVKAAEHESHTSMQQKVSEIEYKIRDQQKEIYSNLTTWQRIQVSRHPDRLIRFFISSISVTNSLSFSVTGILKTIKLLFGGLGEIDGKTYMLIGHQKGVNTKMRQYRNFGMPNPEGYRKALRLMKLAEKFNKPIVTLIDTPGAYPGEEAEARGQGEAIARNLDANGRVESSCSLYCYWRRSFWWCLRHWCW